MIKVIIGVAIGIVIGSLVKPVGKFVYDNYLKLKTWWKNR